MILGDSLLVMTSLAEKEGLKGKVQVIYMDSPYGIKFGSNWQVSTRKRDVKDGKAEDATREPEVIKAFRDTWELGIHSYVAYLRERLAVARELLSETGSVFVQIGDANVHLVRSLLDEVVGSENFVSQILYRKEASRQARHYRTHSTSSFGTRRTVASRKRGNCLSQSVRRSGSVTKAYGLNPQAENERNSLKGTRYLPVGGYIAIVLDTLRPEGVELLRSQACGGLVSSSEGSGMVHERGRLRTPGCRKPHNGHREITPLQTVLR